MELLSEDRISDESLLNKIDCFLESKEIYQSASPTYSEFSLFIDIQYLKKLQLLLGKSIEVNTYYLGESYYTNTKIISESYTVLTPMYLKRKLKQLSDSLERVNSTMQSLLKQTESYSQLTDPNNWFEWWNEYVETLTEVEWEYISDCRKHLKEPIGIQPQKTLVQFVIEQQEKSRIQSEPTRSNQKRYKEVASA